MAETMSIMNSITDGLTDTDLYLSAWVYWPSPEEQLYKKVFGRESVPWANIVSAVKQEVSTYQLTIIFSSKLMDITEPQTEWKPKKSVRAIALLDEWLNDESGYDEKTWPELKKSLDRERLSNRRLFDAESGNS